MKKEADIQSLNDLPIYPNLKMTELQYEFGEYRTP